jgi:hypothetical protein
MSSFSNALRFGVLALAVGFGSQIVSGASAMAGPYVSSGQWTSDPGVKFVQCWNRGGKALAAVGLQWGQAGRYFKGSNDAFTVSLICYDLGNRFIVTITVAQSGKSSMTTEQVRDRVMAVIFATSSVTTPVAPQGGSQPGVVGSWNWTANCGGGDHNGTFTIPGLQSDGTFAGPFVQVDNQSLNGTIAGRFASGKVAFTRHSSQDNQQWNGTLDQTGRKMAGNITAPGYGCGWTASKQ